MIIQKNEYAYGIIAYNSRNIGDEIQSIAAMRFLPSVDEYVFREAISRFKPVTGKKTKCIMNAWWMWRPKFFPPSDAVEPLLISMHLRPRIHDALLTDKTKAYLIEHGPVGCRDQESCDYLNSKGVPAYHSGCLTLTLKRNHDIPREDYVLCVDVPEKVVEKIKKLTTRPIYSVSRTLFPFDPPNRMELARVMLSLYHNAHCCISPRLHVITPCLAMETPVLRLVNNELESAQTDTRYAGMEHFYHTTSVSEFMEKDGIYNFENPPANPSNHFVMRDELIARCKAFTGYDSESSPALSNIDALIKLIKINEFREKDVYRSLFFAPKADLKSVLSMRKASINHFDLMLDNKVAFTKPLWNYKLRLWRYKFINFIFRGKNTHYRQTLESLLAKTSEN